MLAPINARDAAYPTNADRTFGPWGLSFASDRWDLRRALVLEGIAVAPGLAPQPGTVLYLDLQAATLLYQIWYEANGDAIFPSYHVGRWSEDRPDYPRWPDDPDREVRVIDEVGRVTFTDQGGCRIEAWESTAIPPGDRNLRRMLATESLSREGR